MRLLDRKVNAWKLGVTFPWPSYEQWVDVQLITGNTAANTSMLGVLGVSGIGVSYEECRRI